MVLRPFFSYFGSKWMLARHYPAPTHDTIIEPFAGSAGYALNYSDRKVILYDVDPVIVGVWDYLIHASAQEIMRLPLEFDRVSDLTYLSQEVRWLLGFWVNKGVSSPRNMPSAWMRLGKDIGKDNGTFWGKSVRDRLALQVDQIRHWEIIHLTYKDINNRTATWFVDPPYYESGKGYCFNDVKFDYVGSWCKGLEGQVIVCEQEGADWLPFKPFREMCTVRSAVNGIRGKEVVWIKSCEQCFQLEAVA